MKTKILLFACIFFSSVFAAAQIIHVPGDQPTIQAGIDAANESDTVLVQPGTWYENIILSKNITIASLFLTTGDTSYISQTVINGNQNGCVVKIYSGSDSNAALTGFTITNGKGSVGFHSSYTGGGVTLRGSNPYLSHLRITNNTAPRGGGIFCDSSSIILEGVDFCNNSATRSNYNDGLGGGIYCTNNSNILMKEVTISDNLAEMGGGIYCSDNANIVFDDLERCNIFYNVSDYGKEVYSENSIEMVLDTFSVLFPSQFYVEPLEKFTFDIISAKIQQVDVDLYISPTGSNSNSGLSEEEPLKNINFASSIIRANSQHHHTIHLLEGIYSPSSNNETFPVRIYDYCNLAGSSAETVILDAEEQAGVMVLYLNSTSIVSSISLMNGLTQPDIGKGGGVYSHKSTATLQNLQITNNEANAFPWGGGAGGGVYLNESNLTLFNVIVSNNTARGMPLAGGPGISGGNGGGIHCHNHSDPLLQNVSILGNDAVTGGGIYCSGNSFPNLRNVSITGNHASRNGGGIVCTDSSFVVFDSNNRCNIYQNEASYGDDIYTYGNIDMGVIVDTFSVLLPHDYHAYPVDRFSFDILHGKVGQIDADVWVSPDGDNENSGLTEDEPLKNIYDAFYKLISTSQHPRVINLMEGTYSQFSNAETFPIRMLNYSRLNGISTDDVILWEQANEYVLEVINQDAVIISDLTLKGDTSLKSGIYCSESNLSLENLVITDHVSTPVPGYGSWGGVIQLWNSKVIIKNNLIFNNVAARGAAIYCNHTDLEIQNSTISDNLAYHWNYGGQGGGIFCSDSSNITILNSIMWNDSDEEIWFSENEEPNTITINYSDIQGGESGIIINGNGSINWNDDNINEDPLFEGVGYEPYSLSSGSPCIDAGTLDTTGLFILPWDILGNQRIWDGDGDGVAVVDMGAYEFGSLPVGYDDFRPQAASRKLQVYPNPSFGISDIRYRISDIRYVTLEVLDIHGQIVRILVTEEQKPGDYVVGFNGSDLPGGIYFVRLRVGAIPETIKIILIK